MHSFVMGHGVGKEDGNVLVSCILMTLLRELQGHSTVVLVMDCCATGYNALVDWLVHFVVDELHWVKNFGVVYFWNLHGKGPADSKFSQHLSLYNDSDLFSMEMWAHLITGVENKRTREKDTSTILTATGLDDWREFATRRTGGLVPFPDWIEFKLLAHHEVRLGPFVSLSLTRARMPS
jgi:hypothetical protein